MLYFSYAIQQNKATISQPTVKIILFLSFLN